MIGINEIFSQIYHFHFPNVCFTGPLQNLCEYAESICQTHKKTAMKKVKEGK